MESISAPTPAPDQQTVAANTCERCGDPAPAIPTGLAFAPTVLSRYCATCDPVVRAEELEADVARRVDVLLGRAGGARMRDWSLDTYPADPEAARVRAAATRWLASLEREDVADADQVIVRGPTLVFFGPVGTGKTGLAWALVRALCEELVEARLVNFRDYLFAVKQSFREGVPQDDRPHSIPVLALDDLGAERPTDFARDELATLVERRHMSRLPTIVTSNYEPGELAARLGHDDLVIGQRIVSRLVEGAVQVRFAGGDRRLAA